MQLVLNDQFRWQEPSVRELRSVAGIAWTIESVLVESLNAAEKRPDLARPRQRREFVHRSDHEAWKPAINRLVHRDDGKVRIARKFAPNFYALHNQVGRVIVVR